MSNIIDTIRLSGTDYTLSATSSGVSVVEITQSDYDNLPSSAKTDTSKMYVITDAQAGDLTQYWTSAQTSSAITQATSGKVDTTTFNAYSGSVETALSGKQDTLVSGTNIKTINNESLLGSGNIVIQGGGGGGKAIEAGRGISITTGATADTVSFDLPIYSGFNLDGTAAGEESIRFTTRTNFGSSKGLRSIRGRYNSNALGEDSICFGINSYVRGNISFGVGRDLDSYGDYATIFGYGTNTKNLFETAIGKYNTSNSGSTEADNTLFSVGNGTANDARHNAFEIRQNGDIYLTSGGTDIKLQDHLGGGGGSITIDPSLDSGSTNPVANSAITNALHETYFYNISKESDSNPQTKFTLLWKYIDTKQTTYFNPSFVIAGINGIKIASLSGNPDRTNFELIETSAITTSISSSSTDTQVPSAKAVNDKLGGLSLVKLTESEYAALVDKNPNVLYVVIPDPQYRWTQSGTTCIGYDKYQNNIKEQSIDGGETWTVVIPEEYSASTLIESQSTDCGYIPPTPTTYTYSITIQGLDEDFAPDVKVSIDWGGEHTDTNLGNGTYTYTTSSESLSITVPDVGDWHPDDYVNNFTLTSSNNHRTVTYTDELG